MPFFFLFPRLWTIIGRHVHAVRACDVFVLCVFRSSQTDWGVFCLPMRCRISPPPLLYFPTSGRYTVWSLAITDTGTLISGSGDNYIRIW